MQLARVLVISTIALLVERTRFFADRHEESGSEARDRSRRHRKEAAFHAHGSLRN